ncbi:SPBc2 prophage-derived glycosyltransferase SunS [compost metagenome]|nr:glycosyltransferase family 2 protein [Paenibacillus timonensis]
MKTLSLLMIVKNEAGNLERCLKSACFLVDEIIVVDTGSTDNTKEIATCFGAKVYDYIWNDDFSQARNYAIRQSTSDWNLMLDADEYFVKDYSNEIRHFIENSHAIGRVKIVNKYHDKNGTGYSQSFISRLFPKGLYYEGRVHEQIASELPRVKLSVEVQHDGYFMKNKSARNIPILEHELRENPQNPYYYYQIAKEYRGQGEHELAYQYLVEAYRRVSRTEMFAPNVIVDFIYAIIETGNFDEGISLIANEREFLWDFSDFHFASAVFLLDLIMSNPQYSELIPVIEQSYLRCLEIGDTDQYDSVIGTGSYLAYHNLGTYYEVTGNLEKACDCYKNAANYNYGPSIMRIDELKRNSAVN